MNSALTSSKRNRSVRRFDLTSQGSGRAEIPASIGVYELSFIDQYSVAFSLHVAESVDEHAAGLASRVAVYICINAFALFSVPYGISPQ